MEGDRAGAVIGGGIQPTAPGTGAIVKENPEGQRTWGDHFLKDAGPVNSEEEIYARALAIMVQPGRKMIVTGWAICIVIGLGVISCGGTILALALDRGVPVKTLRVDTSELEGKPAGFKGRLHFFVDRKRSCPVLVQRVYKDSGGERYTDPKERPRPFPAPPADELGRQDFWAEAIVPESMDPGPACGYVDLQYTCNPLQSYLNWPVPDQSPRFCWNVGKSS